MPRRQRHPMPIERLISHSVSPILPAAPFGALLRLCLHYWQTDCAPLPASQAEVMQIARAHRATWKRWRNEILSVFDVWAPEARQAFERRDIARNAASIAGLRSGQSRRVKARMVGLDGLGQFTPPARTSPLREAAKRTVSTVGGSASAESRYFSD